MREPTSRPGSWRSAAAATAARPAVASGGLLELLAKAVVASADDTLEHTCDDGTFDGTFDCTVDDTLGETPGAMPRHDPFAPQPNPPRSAAPPAPVSSLPTVLPVAGCAGSAGATILSVAMATAAGAPARVIECSGQTRTGLAAAAHAELGAHDGWARGYRDQVMLERVARPLTRVEDVPAPLAGRPGTLTLLDLGWPLPQPLTAPGWVGATTRGAAAVVLVTHASVPGARQLAAAARLLRSTGWDGLLVAAIRGPGRPPRPVTQALARDGATDHLTTIPHDRGLALHGLTHRPLPAGLLRAAQHLLAVTTPQLEGQPL